MIEQTVRIAARPETVWRYWTDPERMREWWGVAAELHPRPGGTCRVEMGGGPVMVGEFVELVPHERIVFTFGWEPSGAVPPVPPGSTRVEVTLVADGADTVLTLRHTGLPDATTAEHRSGWSHFLPLLADAASRRRDVAPPEATGPAAVDVITETLIARPVEVVASYAGDPTNAPEWYANITSVRWETPPRLGPGSRLRFVARFLGRRLEYTYEVVDHVPGERLVMRTAQGPFPMETTYTWEPAGDGATRMTLRNRGEPSGFSRLVAPFMAAAVRRANGKDLARLKSVLEAAPGRRS